MATASESTPIQLQPFLAEPKKLFIDGHWVEAVDGAFFDVLNPSTTQLVAQVAHGKKADIQHAVQAARKAFDAGPLDTNDSFRSQQDHLENW